MNAPLIISNEILIQKPAAVVWDWLVNPAKTKQYMFGCETVSDWKPGSPLLWKGEYEGREMVFVKGDIVSIEPGRLLAYTVIDPFNPNIPDIPENYLTVTYELKEENGHTRFTVTQGDYATVAEGEKRYKDSYNNGAGWQPLLEQIKALTEAEE